MPDITDPLPMPEPKLPEKSRPPLPYPDTMRQSKGPGLPERLWCNRWNLVRHFILGGCAAAVTAYTTSKSWTATGGAFVIGGVAGLVRKGGDDELRAAGKADILTAAAKAVGAIKPKGGAMSTRTDVEEVGQAIYDLTMAIMSADEDKAGKIVTATLAMIKEGADLKDMPKDDIPEAIAHALSSAAAKAIAAKVVYTDEKPNA